VILLDPDSTIPIIVLVALLALHALFAATGEAIAYVRKFRRVQLLEKGNSAARFVDRLAEDAALLLTTEQLILKTLGFFILMFALLVYTGILAQSLAVNTLTAAALITLAMVVVTLLFAELIPREIGRRYTEAIAFFNVYPFHWISYLTAPLARLITKISRVLTGQGAETEKDIMGTITEEDLLSYVEVGEEEGIFKEEEKEMIYSIFDLDDTLVREVMVPRIDIVAVSADTSVEEAMRVITQAGYSRVPVYVDSIDNIIGILYVKDLLVYWLDKGESRPVRGLERRVYYVPETKPVGDLLRELQAKKVHIAIIVDEYGGTAGLVTIEDLLEEIVGEIQDEHDADEFYMQYISDDEYIFSARMDLDDINDLMAINLPTNESDTLGGLVYDALGRIPKTGDSVEGASFGVLDVRLTVLDVEGRRIKTVKVERIKEITNEVKKQQLKVAADNPAVSLVNKTQNRVSQS
jgi:CBS domain containing-hemolysin-like protein